MKLKNVSRLILLFSIFFTTVLSGCVEEIDYSHYNQRQVVVNCILTSDSVQHLSLTYSNELHNTIYDEVEDATALLYEDGYLVGTFKKSAYAEWVLKYRPKFGRNYRLEVKVEGKETIYAETKFPKELRVYREYERDTIGKLAFNVSSEKPYWVFSFDKGEDTIIHILDITRYGPVKSLFKGIEGPESGIVALGGDDLTSTYQTRDFLCQIVGASHVA